jgi:hypothetical protein
MHLEIVVVFVRAVVAAADFGEAGVLVHVWAVATSSWAQCQAAPLACSRYGPPLERLDTTEVLTDCGALPRPRLRLCLRHNSDPLRLYLRQNHGPLRPESVDRCSGKRCCVVHVDRSSGKQSLLRSPRGQV